MIWSPAYVERQLFGNLSFFCSFLSACSSEFFLGDVVSRSHSCLPDQHLTRFALHNFTAVLRAKVGKQIIRIKHVESCLNPTRDLPCWFMLVYTRVKTLLCVSTELNFVRRIAVAISKLVAEPGVGRNHDRSFGTRQWC